MKRFLVIPVLFLICFFSLNNIFAQAPDEIVYQAQARDLDGKILTVKTLEVKVTIMQGSPEGTIVWEATHILQTDKYGLFTLTFRDGASNLYDFSAIEWGSYSHFLNVKFDKKGTWIDLGTTQFLSVPYALHANTADRALIDNVDDADADPTNELITSVNLNGTSLEVTDAGGTIVQDLSSLVDDADSDPTNELNTSVNLNGTSLEVTDAGGTLVQDLSSLVDDADSDPTNELQDLSGYALKSNVLELNNTSEFSPDADYEPATKKYVDDAVYSGHYIGENYGGGIVFWVDETGEHGLIASTHDQAASIKWNHSTGGTRAWRDGVGAGIYNTERAVVYHTYMGAPVIDGALAECTLYKGGDYGDWYLPSKYELNLLYLQKDIVGGFSAQSYWSSTEYDQGTGIEVWNQDFSDGTMLVLHKDYTLATRAIRRF